MGPNIALSKWEKSKLQFQKSHNLQSSSWEESEPQFQKSHYFSSNRSAVLVSLFKIAFCKCCSSSQLEWIAEWKYNGKHDFASYWLLELLHFSKLRDGQSQTIQEKSVLKKKKRFITKRPLL